MANYSLCLLANLRPSSCFPVWNIEVMAGGPAATLGHERTLTMESTRTQAEKSRRLGPRHHAGHRDPPGLPTSELRFHEQIDRYKFERVSVCSAEPRPRAAFPAALLSFFLAMLSVGGGYRLQLLLRFSWVVAILCGTWSPLYKSRHSGNDPFVPPVPHVTAVTPVRPSCGRSLSRIERTGGRIPFHCTHFCPDLRGRHFIH